jgi:hypothetical protein
MKLHALLLMIFVRGALACMLLMGANANAAFPATSDPSVCTVSPCYGYKLNGWTPDRPWLSSVAAVCADYASTYNAKYPDYNMVVKTVDATSVPPKCTIHSQTYNSDASGQVSTRSETPSQPVYSCPANSTVSGSSCTCSANFQENSAHNACEPETNLCTAKTGKPWITNFTVGYTRTDGLGSNSDDYACVGGCNKLPASMQVCDAGCTVDMGDPKAAWRSTEPTQNGLYRMSIDFVSVPTGAKCNQSASDAPVNPSTPEPPCPGFVGEINGKKGCYGTAGSPINTTQADRSVSGAAPGNPAAGNKPISGEGSGSTGAGRTPTAGTGGPSGGPASAAIGPKGVISKPAEGQEQQACGAPGQPKCGIDETGTPDGKGVLPTTDFNNKLKELEDALPGIVNPAGKDTSWGVVPQWTQGGTCSPWHVATMPPALGSFVVTVDLCPHKAFTDGIANFIWLGLAFFGITGLIFSTMTSKAS